MRILAVDIGGSKSVVCHYQSPSAERTFETIPTTPQAFHDLIVQRQPDVVVIEICTAAGWIRDLCEALAVRLIVANTSDEPWRWRKVKRKTDRDDALKLAKLLSQNEINAVHVPVAAVRQWRMLIQYRHQLKSACSAIRTRIRCILDSVALKLPGGGKAFTGRSRASWSKRLCQPLDKCPPDQLWRGMVDIELQRLEQTETHLAELDEKLAELAAADERVSRLQEAPNVGIRTAELVVATIDDPNRFGRGKQLGNYVGFTPKKYQSGTMDRDGRISRGGCGLLRALLVQASWSGVVRNVPWMVEVYERARRGSPQRRKQAIIAVARRLLIRLWAMLRDGTHWQDQIQPA